MAFKFGTFRRRIGITGTYYSGKTVFLTSLIDHLLHHDPSKFELGKDITIRKSKVYFDKEKRKTMDNFNYLGNRDALVNEGKWPAKTRDCSHVNCSFERTDWRFTKADLHFFDFPGERMADAGMVGSDFGQWSDAIHASIGNIKEYRQLAQDYLRVVNTKSTEDGIIAAYKNALAHFVCNYMPFVSPSTFLLDVKGQQPKRGTPDQIGEGRFVGLEQEGEFAPLPADARDRNPDLTATFSQRYDKYKQHIVSPLMQRLKKCHRLIVLIDIPTLLGSGTMMYNGTNQILKQLLDVLNPGKGFVTGMLKQISPQQWHLAGITRIAFVAPKADLVHEEDRDKVKELLRSLAYPLASNIDYLISEYYTCSAVVSTKLLKNKTELTGNLRLDKDGQVLSPRGEPRTFSVSRVPDAWPNGWKAGDYVFPEVYPRMPARMDAPPEQMGLNQILEFILGEEFWE